MQGEFSIGVDAGGTKVAYGLFDGSGALRDRMEHPTDMEADGPAFADTVLAALAQMLARNRLSARDLAGVGLCMPSFILFDEGYVCMTSAMPNLRDFPMRAYLADRLETRVVLDNDSNAAALAEHRHGAGRGRRHMVYMAVSTGIGSGIIIDHRLFHGSYGFAGECGHMLITPGAGLTCGCQNQGCFMSYASGRYAPLHAKARMAAGEQSLLAGRGDITAKDILAAYRAGDPLADGIIGQMGRYIGICAFNIYQLLNINLFVFGGGLVNFGHALFDRVRAAFDQYNHIPQPVDFRFAELKTDFGITGAAELIKE